MRFFVALEIPESSKSELETIQTRLAQIIPNLRLTDPQKLHLTIAFIGEQEESLKDRLVQLMTAAAQGIPAFTITPAYLDGFPNLHHPQTLWVGVKGEIDKLMLVRERVKDGLIELGLEVDFRRYTPHIAIAKVNPPDFNLTPEVELKIQQLMQSSFQPIPVSEIKLFESIPDHGFHSHNTLAEIKLD